jgi:hypothetical protein
VKLLLVKKKQKNESEIKDDNLNEDEKWQNIQRHSSCFHARGHQADTAAAA